MKLEALPDRNKRGDTLWRVLEDIRVQVAPRMYVQVPEGYVSNLGTIPRIPGVRWLVSPDDTPMEFVIHDWMANEDHVDDGVPVKSGYSRWIADAVLYELMSRRKYPAWKSWLVWAAIRLHARVRGLK